MTDADRHRKERIIKQVAGARTPTLENDCPYCQAGHRRHSARDGRAAHTIVVKCWDKRPFDYGASND